MMLVRYCICLGCISTLLLPIGCNENQPNELEVKQFSRSIVINQAKFNKSHRQEYTISGAIIENDSLILDVQYGGGCGAAIFELITDGLFLESNPVQLNVKLTLDDQDNCEALLDQPLSFGIRELTQLFEDEYLTPHGIIILRLEHYQENLTFSF